MSPEGRIHSLLGQPVQCSVPVKFFLVSRGNSCLLVYGHCSSSCHWAPLERVWHHPLVTHICDICKIQGMAWYSEYLHWRAAASSLDSKSSGGSVFFIILHSSDYIFRSGRYLLDKTVWMTKVKRSLFFLQIGNYHQA